MVMRWINNINPSRFFKLFLILICILTIILSVLLYFYLNTSSKKVVDIATDYTMINSMSKIKDIKKILENKFEIITSTLGLLSRVPSIQNQNISAIPIIEFAQSTTGNITKEYNWFDAKGKSVWSSSSDMNKTIQTYPQLSFNTYTNLFKTMQETFKPHIDFLYQDPDITKIPTIIISYPVLSLKSSQIESKYADNKTIYDDLFLHGGSEISIPFDFKTYNTSFLKDNFDLRGMIVATIDKLKLSSFLDSILNDTGNNIFVNNGIQNLSNLTTRYILFDNKGIFLFSNADRFNVDTAINKTVENFFENLKEIKNKPAPVQPTLNNSDIIFTNDKSTSTFFNDSSFGVIKPLKLSNTIINYVPLLLNGEPFMHIITLTPLTLGESTNAFIDSQISNTFVFIGILYSLIFAFVTIIMYINKNLKKLVDEKTNDLVEAFMVLNDNNRQLQQANNKLVQSTHQQREFVDNAAHELRTPTQAILGYCELNEELFDELLKEKISDEKLLNLIFQISGYQKLVTKNSARLSDLINDLLDVAKFDSNNVILNKEKFDLIKEINNLIKVNLSKKIKDKEIQINFNKSEMEQCIIYADKLRITQVINNLLDNAIKFTNNGGIISIDIENFISDFQKGNLTDTDDKGSDIWKDLQKGEVLIRISDTGKGINKNVLPKIFERFVTDSESGTGLGLFIAKSLIQAHNGHIRAFNNKNKPGATFEIILPTM